MKKLPLILTLLVVAAVVAIVAVLGMKMKASPNEDEETSAEISTADYSESEYSITSVFENTTQENSTVVDVTEPSSENADTTAENQSSTQKQETTLVEKITAITTAVNTEFKSMFTMPKAPKYIPPDVNVNFDTASLLAYKYDPNGNYYYTDDKNSWQRGFGYNQIYDKLAIVSAMYYDTVRTTFKYEDKDWLVQIWKGQYGYYFVGGEIGIYTKTYSGDTYACADKSDWVKMEMCFFWDENRTGDYKAVFSRPYDDYWWCTGFVVGFESLNCMKSRDQFRIVAHITFKSTEMAQLFSEAFENNGFRRVSKLNNYEKDTFVQAGPDVAFVWQSINQHVI